MTGKVTPRTKIEEHNKKNYSYGIFFSLPKKFKYKLLFYNNY